MAGIDLSGITLNPIEVQEVKDFILERVFERPEIIAIHGRIETGVTMKEQIVFASSFGKMGLKKAGTCDRQSSNPTSTLSEKYWLPVGIEDTLVICQAEVNGLFKAYYNKVQRYKELYDITGTDMEVFYAIMIEESMVKLIWRAAWFGDTAVAAAAAGTAGLASAADVKFYDYFDGLWKQIFAGVTAGKIPRVTITQNAIITSKADQLVLAAGAAKAYIRAIKDKADVRLRSNPEGKIMVTRELFDNYKQGLEDAGAAFDVTLTLEGLPMISYDGTPVINMETIWGLDGREDFLNNTTDNVYYLPHRILYTVPNNIPLGTLNENDFTELEQWYNIDERKNKTAFGFTLDAKELEEYMIVTGY